MDKLRNKINSNLVKKKQISGKNLLKDTLFNCITNIVLACLGTKLRALIMILRATLARSKEVQRIL